MNRIYIILVTILLSLTFFSCQSIRIIEIETINPSVVTFPQDVKTVMIVNNSAQQPDNIGHSSLGPRVVDTLRSVSADSMAYIYCMALGKALIGSPRFDDVRMCDDTLRRDSSFYRVRPFTFADVETFCSDYGVDALISLDKLFAETIFFDSRNNVNSAISVEISGELRVFWPGQKEVYTIPVSDSLNWYSTYDSELLLESDVRIAMLYLSEHMGREAHVNFVPHWSDDQRWYYTNMSSEWKSGTAYVRAEKWAEAINIWEPLYNKANKWKHKAKLSSNIALCYEMISDLGKAIKYAEFSYDLFKENDKEDSPYTNLQNLYIESLKKRKDADMTLSKQF